MNVHVIFNAHIDPIWLWPWQSGLDEVLATCRSACDHLDAHPELVFTRGEAWVYEQVERLDPELFARIRRHVESGQWEIVGGWWIQPDCNLPSGWAFERQIELGREYFQNRFGRFPRIAYNVDSFGHAATLPTIMRAAGQDRYVMMRPQQDEMSLPAHLFRWREKEGSAEVVTFRIASGYLTYEPSLERVKRTIDRMPEGIEHTMCFMGVGDHGGGPTERQIAWCRENENAIPGARIVMSSPSRFFDAVEGQTHTLPLVTGELQMHAVGCYTVHRPVKLGVRRGEHLLRQAEIMQQTSPQPQAVEPLHEAWKRVCFHHFHDTLGGTCLPSAFQQVQDQLGYAAAVADETLQYGLRLKLRELPDDALQRIVLCNASDAPFDGFIEFEPWLDWQEWNPEWQLQDADGVPVPFQRLHSESLAQPQPRLLFERLIAPAGLNVVKIAKHAEPAPEVESLLVALSQSIGNEFVSCSPTALAWGDDFQIATPHLALIEDPSDTWSHWIDRYPEGPGETAQWSLPSLIDSGPLMASLMQTGRIGQSTLKAEWRVYADEPFIELKLNIHWCETNKVLKMVVPLEETVETRTDGILAGNLERPNNGRECPLRDWTLLDLQDAKLAVVCPDVFGLDATPSQVRLTLLRSSVMAYHVPYFSVAPRKVISDQGVHEFRFRFFIGEAVSTELLDAHAFMMQRPLVVADLTRGMPKRFD
jgi:alpha-mannosidase